jgi:hypothetical protein
MGISQDNNEELFFNGINGSTGDYLFAPQTMAEMSEAAQQSLFEKIDGESKSDPTDDEHLSALIDRDRQEAHFGTKVDEKEISQTGWGIIFARTVGDDVRDALKVLRQHRLGQAGEDFYKEYQIGGRLSAHEFLSEYNDYLIYGKKGEHNSTSMYEAADPKKVPYYLLIVGDFEEIPFSFQYQLDVQYAVGRIYFDTAEEYAQYAEKVVQAETTNLTLPCRANLFGVRTPGDRATELSADYLVKPLNQFFESDQHFLKENSHWQINTHLEEQATKAQLGQLLGGEDMPALLFTASHGVGFDKDDVRQEKCQGALLCQDWPGPGSGEMKEDYFFSADDIGEDTKLDGLISFHFACFGAGTPKVDDFGHRDNSFQQIAEKSFIAKLPQRLLSRGALAFVGHVDRAWGYSFGGNDHQITSFENTLEYLMKGYPVGAAIEWFNERYAAVSSELTENLWKMKVAGKKSDDRRLSYLWTTNNDARGYAIIGDPAVRLMVGNYNFTEQSGSQQQLIEYTASQASQSSDNTDSDRTELVESLNRLITQINESQQPSTPISNQLKLLFERLDNKVQQAETDDDISKLETELTSLVKRL